MTSPKEAITVVKDALETGDKALELYNKVLDQIVPWKTFEDTITDLAKYQKDYSTATGALVGEVKTLLLTANDKYLAATQSVFEWCGLTTALLGGYLTLFDNYTAEKANGQKTIVIKVLSEGLTKMDAAQKSLQASSESFNAASGKLITLNVQMKSDFDSGSVYFEAQVDKLRKEAYGGAAVGVLLGPLGLLISYSVAAGVLEGQLIPKLKKGFEEVTKVYEEMTTLVVKADKDISATKAQLQKEIVRIGEMKTQTEATKVFVDLDGLMVAELKAAANKLIEQCRAYQNSHSGRSILAA